jgi:hypothetical protein
MPVGPTRTKADKRKVMKTEMGKFGEGDLHSGSKKGPVVTNPKQAEAIGLSESKQSKKKPVKEEGYDRSSHFPGNPGFNREGKPPYGEYDGGANAKQPQGKSIGVPDIDKPHGHHTYEQEAKEHSGLESKGGDGEGRRGEVANVGTEKRGTELVGKGPAPSGHKQPQGKSIGAGTTGLAEHHKGHGMGPAHSFKMPQGAGTHGFTGTHKRGAHRVSGAPGAHMVGQRSK